MPPDGDAAGRVPIRRFPDPPGSLPLRNRIEQHLVGADSIRPNVTRLNRSLNGTMSDVAPFNRVLSKNRGCGRLRAAPWGAG